MLWSATLIGHGSSLQVALAASVGAGTALLVAKPRSLGSPAGPDQPTHRALPATDIDVSVILAAAVDGIMPVIDRARSVAACLLDADREFEIIVVTPRSHTTATEQLAGVDRSRVRLLIHDQGNTKGAALRAGAAAAAGRHVVFLDSEADISVSHIPQYLDLLSFYAADVVVGSKRHPDSLVDYPPLRRIYSWAYQQLVRGLFRLSVRDLRVGLKVFTRETIIDALPHTTNGSFVFELELLSIARKAGHRRIVEAPVAIDKRFSSAVSIRTTVRELAATIALRARLPRLHHGVPHYPEHGRPAPGVVPEPFRWPVGPGSALVQK